jgi:hypothetical protein
MIIEIDRLKLKVIQLEEEVEKQRLEIDRLETDRIRLEQSSNQVADLESQLIAARQLKDPMSLPLGPPALRLRDLQLRIDVLNIVYLHYKHIFRL